MEFVARYSVKWNRLQWRGIETVIRHVAIVIMWAQLWYHHQNKSFIVLPLWYPKTSLWTYIQRVESVGCTHLPNPIYTLCRRANQTNWVECSTAVRKQAWDRVERKNIATHVTSGRSKLTKAMNKDTAMLSFWLTYKHSCQSAPVRSIIPVWIVKSTAFM